MVKICASPMEVLNLINSLAPTRNFVGLIMGEGMNNRFTYNRMYLEQANTGNLTLQATVSLYDEAGSKVVPSEELNNFITSAIIDTLACY